jgi:hypothetical protein
MVSALTLSLLLQSGIYQCAIDRDICDQDVRVYETENKITALKVEYIGHCGSMGPYFYYCTGNVCRDGNAEFTLNGNNTYHWKNLGHPYECQFTPASPKKN